LKKQETTVIALLLICLIVSVAFLGFIVDFSSGGTGPGRGGDEFDQYNAPFQTTKATTVHISMGYTPAKGVVLYCTYTITDTSHKVIASSLLLHFPFSSEYIIDETLTNLANDDYTAIMTAHYADGSTRTSGNQTFTVDTAFKYPVLNVISPQNQTYHTNQINMTYYTNSKIIYSYYSLNGGDWLWFHGNTTLNGLPNGSYTLGIFVVTDANLHINEANEGQTANFTVNSP
jgi:hypothetical protein